MFESMCNIKSKHFKTVIKICSIKGHIFQIKLLNTWMAIVTHPDA